MDSLRQEFSILSNLRSDLYSNITAHLTPAQIGRLAMINPTMKKIVEQQTLPSLEEYIITDIRQIPQLKHMKFLKQLTLKQGNLFKIIKNLNKKAIDVFAKYLFRLGKLRILNLSNNRLGIDGMKILAPSLRKLFQLRRLDLNNNELNKIGNIGGIRALTFCLEQLVHLRELNLTGNQIDRNGIALLASSLKNLKQLQYLYIGANNIGSVGMISFAPVLEELIHLQRLNISDNKIQVEGMALLRPSLERLTN